MTLNDLERRNLYYKSSYLARLTGRMQNGRNAEPLDWQPSHCQLMVSRMPILCSIAVTSAFARSALRLCSTVWRECWHSTSGLAVLFRQPAGSGHIGPRSLSLAKIVGPGHAQFPRFHIFVNGIRRQFLQGKIIIFS